MRRVVVTVALIFACGDDRPDAKPETRCEQLREHLIDLRLADAMHVDKDAHREALRGSMGNEFLTSCAKLSDQVVACGLTASDSTTAAACEREAAR